LDPDLTHQRRHRANIGFETKAGRPVHLSDTAAESRESAGRFRGVVAGVVTSDLPERTIDQREEQLHDIATILRELVRGAVATQDHIFRHVDLTPAGSGSRYGRAITNQVVFL
jgi:hypothetical protein